MPTSQVKRRLRDMALPISKRTKLSYGFQDTQPINNESTFGNSSDTNKDIMEHNTSIEPINHDIPNDKAANVILNPMSSKSTSRKSVANKTKRYGCKLCWRRFQLKNHAKRHKQKAHRVQKAPMECTNCSCVFEELVDNGPWNDCCMISIRKYFMLRTLM